MAAKNSGYSGFDYGVVIGPDGESTGKISCFPSNSDRCTVIRTPKPGLVGGFVSLARAADFHDDELADVTGEINKLLGRAMDSEAKGQGRSLHVLSTAGGPMLAWLDQHVTDDDGIPDFK